MATALPAGSPLGASVWLHGNESETPLPLRGCRCVVSHNGHFGVGFPSFYGVGARDPSSGSRACPCASRPMTEVLKAAHLSKAFNGTPVRQDVSLSVQAGEVFGLIGPNGTDKTTTIRLLLHILQPDAGAVTLFGHSMDAQARDRIGNLPGGAASIARPAPTAATVNI
jgi:ABC-type multidrug transport system fused ATPase/permease subunit